MSHRKNVEELNAKQMMSHINHYLRNPNAKIEGMTKLVFILIKDLGIENNEIQAYLDMILKATDEINEVQNEISIWLNKQQ